jgi:hypothetical protein
MLQTYYNTWVNKQGYMKLYSLTEVQQFSTAIFEVHDDDHIGQNM